jgi:hypothetical protein
MAKIFQKKAAPRPIVVFLPDFEIISCEVQGLYGTGGRIVAKLALISDVILLLCE